MNTDYNFYYSGIPETALKLSNSEGSTKLRLHLFGNQVDDRFAVAAEKTDKTTLNWFERKFYVLVPDPETAGSTFYKVNKNSLKKRLLISDKELQPILKKGGLADQEVLDLIKAKHADRLAWTDKVGAKEYSLDDNPTGIYSRIVDALVQAGIDCERYKGIVFYTPTMDHYCFTSDGARTPFSVHKEINSNPNNLRNYNKGEVLTFICWSPNSRNAYWIPQLTHTDAYGDTTDEVNAFLDGENSPLTIIDIDKHAYIKIQKQGKLPSHILKQLTGQ